ncbi:MAG TPA: type II toxin-antitoxin system VapC family toxin [Acidobacteriota bacterium]|nr:type II toxin-antitoxin system VapC family toxin [Blastocatellia bacterium]
MGTVNLREVQEGARILIDANIFVYWLTQRSDDCGRFMQRCAAGNIQGYVSILSLVEVTHRLMMLEAKENDWAKGSNPVRSLLERPERIQSLVRYEERLRRIFALRLHVEDLKQADLMESLSIRRRCGFLTNDAVLLATALRLGIKGIASADKDLERASDYVVYNPSDLTV